MDNCYCINTILYNCCLFYCQCPKLRVHPAPGAHISKAGCTLFGGVHPVCARFLSNLTFLYIGRVPGAIFGCTVLGEVHPVSDSKGSWFDSRHNLVPGSQNNTLISDTDCI